MSIEEYIYESLQGTLCHPHPQVKNLFEEGMPCERWYWEMLSAYTHLCERFCVSENDDIEIIITSLKKIEREIAFEMFRYGAQFQQEKHLKRQ